MASNDYYYGNNKPLPNPSPSPFNAYTPQTSHSTPAPPYSAEPDLSHPSNSRPQQQQQQPYASPFDSPFDDHVYPLDPRQGSSGNMNQPGKYNQDTSYYSHGRVSPDERRDTTEDIPLQNRPGAKDTNEADHVYDAAESGRSSSQSKKKRGNVRLGQLGMFTNGKKRIPWVVYIFSVVQIAVFVGEIIRNGTWSIRFPQERGGSEARRC
jgi:hypothetical protein